MSEIAKIQRNFQITIPASIRKKANIKIGDLIEFESTSEGILVHPVAMIDRDQAWFWSEKWQKEEKKVESDFKKGLKKVSKSVDEFLDDIEK